jgi:sulfur carrier protein
MICLTVNGKPHEMPEGTTVGALLAHLGVDTSRVAIERNQDVVPRRTYDAAVLRDGDKIEIVTFVGGG